MSKSALKFGAGGASIAGIPTSLFGSLGGNPSINALTNADAMAAQQAATNVGAIGAQQAIQPMGSGVSNDMLDPSGLMATGRFNPAARNIGMGMFGDMGARNRSVLGGIGSALMMHDEEKIKRLEAEIADIKANGEDSKFVNEGEDPQRAAFRRQSDIMDEKKKHKEDNEGSPAKHVGQVNAPAGQGHNKNHEDKGAHYHREDPRRKGKYMTVPAKQNK